MALNLIPIDRLRDVVLGRDLAFPRPEAFAELAASELPDREQLLATVLEGDAERTDIRTSAAVALGRIATPDSEQALLESLDEQAPRVQEEIALSLGRIGSGAALAPLDALARSVERRVADAARFGAALIAHRLGLPGHELPMPPVSDLLPPPAAPESRPIEFEPAPPEQTAQILQDLRGHPLQGVAYDEQSITAISCAGAELALALNREITAASVDPFRRKGFAGVVALRSPETGEYSVSLMLLTAPAEEAVNIQLATGSGRLAVAGEATRAGSAAEFNLRAVARPGALAILIGGALDGSSLTVRQAVSASVREPSRAPQFTRVAGASG